MTTSGTIDHQAFCLLLQYNRGSLRSNSALSNIKPLISMRVIYNATGKLYNWRMVIAEWMWLNQARVIAAHSYSQYTRACVIEYTTLCIIKIIYVKNSRGSHEYNQRRS